MDAKQTALSMIVHGDLFWVNMGRALQVATPEQVQAIQYAFPEDYGRFEQSARRIPYEYKVTSQLELVLRSLDGARQNWKVVVNKAKQMGFDELVSHLDQRDSYRIILQLARRYRVSEKEAEELAETAVS